MHKNTPSIPNIIPRFGPPVEFIRNLVRTICTKRRLHIKCIKPSIAACFLLSAVCVHAGELHIDVSYPTNVTGKLYVAVFDNAAAYSKNMPSLSSITDTAGGMANVKFAAVSNGAYAVSVFLDENNNGLLDTNFIGIPVEKYGFSNAAAGTIGRPSFDAAAVLVENQDKRIVIKMQ